MHIALVWEYPLKIFTELKIKFLLKYQMGRRTYGQKDIMAFRNQTLCEIGARKSRIIELLCCKNQETLH